MNQADKAIYMMDGRLTRGAAFTILSNRSERVEKAETRHRGEGIGDGYIGGKALADEKRGVEDQNASPLSGNQYYISFFLSFSFSF